MPGLWTRWTGTRALLMSGLACGLGCGGGNATPDASPVDSVPAPARFAASWQIVAGGAPVSCDALASPLIGVEIVPKDALIGRSDTFSCAAGMAVSDDLEPGLYRIKFELLAGGQPIAEVPEFTDVQLDRGQTQPGVSRSRGHAVHRARPGDALPGRAVGRAPPRDPVPGPDERAGLPVVARACPPSRRWRRHRIHTPARHSRGVSVSGRLRR